ncbi:MAG: hypothetical protein RLZZ493_1248, partial [Bacteroidota bacterium]
IQTFKKLKFLVQTRLIEKMRLTIYLQFVLLLLTFSLKSQTNEISNQFTDKYLDSLISNRLNSNLKYSNLKDIAKILYTKDEILQYHLFSYWIIDLLDYDKNIYKTSSIKTIFRIKKGNCSVYSMFLDSLCFYREIKSEYISGFVKGEFGNPPISHAWNQVIINNIKYYTDLTWCDNKNSVLGVKFSRGYFLERNNQLFALDHFAKKRKFRPYKISFSSFLKSPVFYSMFNNLISDSINLTPLIKNKQIQQIILEIDKIDTNYVFDKIMICDNLFLNQTKSNVAQKTVNFRYGGKGEIIIDNFKITNDSSTLFICVKSKNEKNTSRCFALFSW